MILHLTPEVREAVLDLRALRQKVKEAGERGWEWRPAEANARQRMAELAREGWGGEINDPPKPSEKNHAHIR